jgi:hypothetical protein
VAESSQPWDASSYPASTDDDMNAAAFTDGVVEDKLNLLAVTGATSPVSVNTGWAWVNGKLYKNTAAVTVAVPTPAVSTRIDRIVLRANYTAKTVTIQRLAGVEGGAAPALTQTDGTTWEYSLAQASITTGGVITLTAEALIAHPRGSHHQGDIKPWQGTLSGHYPTQAETGAIDTRWHLANGDTENGVVTLDLRDRFIVAYGTTYTKDSTGGAATKDLSHTHAVGTLAAANESTHVHAAGSIAAANESSHTHGATGLTTGNESSHTHGAGTLANAAEASHTHASTGLSTGNAGANHTHQPGGSTPLYASGSEGTAVWPTTTGSADHTHHVNGSTAAGSSHNHTISGSTGAGSSHNHTMSGSTAAGSAHTHSLSGNSGAGSAHTHTLSGSTASGGSATQDILPPYYALAFLVYVGA